MFIVQPIIVRTIGKWGMPIREDDVNQQEPDDEHIETATEGEYGLGPFVGVANAFLLITVGVLAIGGVGMLVYWITNHKF